MLRRCEDAIVRGSTCNTANRDAAIARAADQLAQQLSMHCRSVTLEDLGFPGLCSHHGGSFSVQDLTTCIEDAAESRVDMAIAIEYPNPHEVSHDDATCQKTIGAAARNFYTTKLKARSHCLDQQLKGNIGSDVNCRAEVPPGTGDPGTDQQIAAAAAALSDELHGACDGITLEDLGFPGMCSDPDGGSFSVDNLDACILSTHES
ncbi:MAG: hypothetical protein E6J72_05865, partial [Deltaproteobacteria bacterium]